MAFKVLIMGLPGAGKTTLAEHLLLELNKTIDVEWFNADKVRSSFNDWDFSPEGRLRQSNRMKTLADSSGAKVVISDFVAPTEELRNQFEADFTIWIDTIKTGRFEDTNKLFEAPESFDFKVEKQDAENIAPMLAKEILKLVQPKAVFDWKKPTTQMLGRWQPWHQGHQELFKKAYAETGQVCIMIRDVGGIVGKDAGAGRTAAQTDNPFDFCQVVENIKQGLAADGFEDGVEYVIMQVPNIVDISYGRGVGYTFTQHDLGEEVHNISATKIRAQLRADGKL